MRRTLQVSASLLVAYLAVGLVFAVTQASSPGRHDTKEVVLLGSAWLPLMVLHGLAEDPPPSNPLGG